MIITSTCYLDIWLIVICFRAHRRNKRERVCTEKFVNNLAEKWALELKKELENKAMEEFCFYLVFVLGSSVFKKKMDYERIINKDESSQNIKMKGMEHFVPGRKENNG